ncbi:MAG: histidine phosphatase family protein [Rhodoferax sp.]|nr:histidine phosphatase family protein [Rhodoferax sp.]
MFRPFVALFLFFCALGAQVGARAGELADKLGQPGYALLMRHALAPGIGDPAGFTVADCASQRNLNNEGRQQAVRTGQWLRQQGVTHAQVLSSPWCRCKETATLLGLGAVVTEPALGSFFDEPQRAREFTEGLQRRLALASSRKGNQALLLVTHHVNILDYMGANIGSGDMVLVQFDSQGKLLNAKRYPSPG